MKSVYEAMRDYLQTHPYDVGDPDCEDILDLLYRAYAETHESDPSEIQSGFIELEEFLKTLPLDDNNAVFNLLAGSVLPTSRRPFSMDSSLARS